MWYGKVVIINNIRVIAADGSHEPVMTDGAGLISRNLAEQMPLCWSGCGRTWTTLQPKMASTW